MGAFMPKTPFQRQMAMREELQIQVAIAKANSTEAASPTGKLSVANKKIEIKASDGTNNPKIERRQFEMRSKKTMLKNTLASYFSECSRDVDSGSIYIKAVTSIYVERLQQELAKKQINLEVVDYVLTCWQSAQELELKAQKSQEPKQLPAPANAPPAAAHPAGEVLPPPTGISVSPPPSTPPPLLPSSVHQDASTQQAAPVHSSNHGVPPPSDVPPARPSIPNTNAQKITPAPSVHPPPLPSDVHQALPVNPSFHGVPPPSDIPEPPNIPSTNPQEITVPTTQALQPPGKAGHAKQPKTGSSLAKAAGYKNHKWTPKDYRDYYWKKLSPDHEFSKFIATEFFSVRAKMALDNGIEKLKEEQQQRDIKNNSGASASLQQGAQTSLGQAGPALHINTQANDHQIEILTRNPATEAAREHADARRYTDQLAAATKLVKITFDWKTSANVQVAMNAFLQKLIPPARHAGLAGGNPVADKATAYYLRQIQNELSNERNLEKIQKFAIQWKIALDYAVLPDEEKNPTSEVLDALSFVRHEGSEAAALWAKEAARKPGKLVEAGEISIEEKWRKLLSRSPSKSKTLGGLRAEAIHG